MEKFDNRFGLLTLGIAPALCTSSFDRKCKLRWL